MKTRKINIVVEIPDDDYLEGKLYQTLYGNLGDESIKGYKVLQDDKELFENDENYRKIKKAYAKAKKAKEEYVFNWRHK